MSRRPDGAVTVVVGRDRRTGGLGGTGGPPVRAGAALGGGPAVPSRGGRCARISAQWTCGPEQAGDVQNRAGGGRSTSSQEGRRLSVRPIATKDGPRRSLQQVVERAMKRSGKYLI